MSESRGPNDPHRKTIDHWEESLLNADASNRTQLAISQPPILVREIVALILLVAVSDVTIYRTHGFAGPAAFFLVAPLLLWLGTPRIRYRTSLWLLVPMLLAISLRLVTCGSELALITGGVVLCCFAMSLAGIPPYVTWAASFASRLVAAGHRGLKTYERSLSKFSPAISRSGSFAVVMPVATLIAFSTIFVMANPDLVKSFGTGFTRIVEFMQRWIEKCDAFEAVFCLATLWIATGLLRPEFQATDTDEAHRDSSEEPIVSPLFIGYRNTLMVVIGLFAVYLAFEFQTLWCRTFPKGFYYSGYAHEGAAWLTMALGLATILLSIMFRGTVLADPRISKLRVLSWVWSLENLLLAAAVFNRLSIYIGFNGMTRMRVVGILGVASVVAGFIFVLIKIARHRNFTWLIRRQLWAVSIAIYVYAIFPVDAYVNSFNVRKILAGDPAPSVQISVHPTSDEGFLMLTSLTNCSDETIRNGVRGILFNKLESLESERAAEYANDWSAIQLTRSALLSRLRSMAPQLRNNSTAQERAIEVEQFRTYAFQWY